MKIVTIFRALIGILLVVQILHSQQTWDPVSATSNKPTRNDRIQSTSSQSWQSIGPYTNDILDFAFNRVNPRVIYAGSRDSGVYRTTDGGSVWTRTSNGITDNFIRALETHPSDSNIVLAGTFNNGLFRTNDGGTNWSHVSSLDDNTILSLTFDERHPDTAYAGTLEHGLYKSMDAGLSWERITPDSLGASAIKISIDPLYSNILTCLFPDSYRVYISEDYGTSWVRLYQGSNNIISFASNPFNRNTMFMGSAATDSLLRTRNGGVSWERLPLADIFTDLIVNPADTEQVYTSAVSSGVFRSTNSGSSWNAINSGLSSFQAIRLKLQPDDPTILYAGTNEGAICRFENITTGVNEVSRFVPTKFSLSQNFPNPFNPSTAIAFNLPSKSYVSLKVFDILGKDIATLVCEELPAGNYTKQWDATNIPSGIYFYSLSADSFFDTKKLVLLR